MDQTDFKSAPERLPFKFARDQGVILDWRPGPQNAQLILAPHATELGLREAARRSAKDATPQIIRETDEGFRAGLARVYHAANDTPQGEDQGQLFDLEDTAAGAARHRDLLDEAGEAPVIQLVNQLLRQAVMASASDLHIEPFEGGLRARMRVDGFLQKIMERDDVPVRRVVSRLKVMAGLDIAETRLPQDGRIPLSLGGRMIDTRVSSLPGNYGERIVLRILDRTAGLMELEALGLSETQIAQLRRMAALPNGIILATGPTGAGKTTTLYSLLKLANRDERNVLTVEDPIEYDLPGISQSQINSEIGMSFAAGLRAALRQDPDVILVGEIRDEETARIAGQAALTGHLVFSSLHANGSVGAVIRLRDLGLEDFLITDTLRGVIAQRLLRKVCHACCVPAAPTDREVGLFQTHGIRVPQTLHISRQGCEACNMSGYRGRVGIFELIDIDENLRVAINDGASETQMRALAIGPGQSLFAQGLACVEAGQTTMDELLRVVGDVA